MTRENQPSSAAQARQARARDEIRFREIDRVHAERVKNLHPSIKYSWEVERDFRLHAESRIIELERSLARAEAKAAQQKATIKSLLRRKNVLLRDEVLAVIGRVPKMPRDILPAVEASYGSLGKAGMRELMRVLAELKESGAIRRVDDGYVLGARR